MAGMDGIDFARQLVRLPLAIKQAVAQAFPLGIQLLVCFGLVQLPVRLTIEALQRIPFGEHRRHLRLLARHASNSSAW